MVFKVNIRQDLVDDMDAVLAAARVKNKTEFANLAIEEKTKQLKRSQMIEELNKYYADPKNRKQAKERLNEYARVRYLSD